MVKQHLRLPAEVAPRSLPSASGAWRSPSRYIMFMLVMSVVTWRAQTVFGGGLDSVVLAKAGLGCMALALAWAARVTTRHPEPMSNVFVWLAVTYVVVSSFGAWSAGGLRVSGVISIRVLLMVVTLILLVKAFPRLQVLNDLLVSFAIVAIVSAVTGLPSLASSGRLHGGLPQMHSNELSLLCAIPLIGLIHLVLQHRATARHAALFVALFSALIATGSRTALITVILAALVILVQTRRFPTWVALLLTTLVPILLYVATRTEALNAYFDRQGPGEGDLSTLNSRSVVWTASLDYAQTSWTTWLGSGLAVKRIPVSGQFWDVQNLDSSWVSALVQAGWVGAILLAVWVTLLIGATVRTERPMRLILQGVLAALLLRSLLESGLVDGSPAFLAFFLVSLISGPRQWTWRSAETPPGQSRGSRWRTDRTTPITAAA